MDLSETPPPTNHHHRLPDTSRNPASSSLLLPPPPPMQDLRPNPGPDGRIFTARHRAPPPQEAQLSLKCPRCDSPDTKFCYYNNYNLSQPRHFCRSCRRYWTRGGVLRNVPVGGGCRRKSSKRPAAATAAANSSPPPPPTKARKLSPPPSDTWKPEPEEAASIAAIIGYGFGDPYPEELRLQELFSDPMAATPPRNEWVDLGGGGGGVWTEMDPSLYLL